jgi:histidine triad (HIT) family protein
MKTAPATAEPQDPYRSSDCVFCQIVAGQAPATVVQRWAGAIAISPRRPVTPGHVLVIPAVHVSDVGVDAAVSSLTMAAAAELAGEHPACNIITSRGADATQTVFHLHIHVVPRRVNDGLLLPWSSRAD